MQNCRLQSEQDLAAGSGMMVLLVKQVHLQNSAEPEEEDDAEAATRVSSSASARKKKKKVVEGGIVGGGGGGDGGWLGSFPRDEVRLRLDA